MAGIGFRLRRLFEHDTYLDDLRGIVFSTSVAGGPIFFSILCLILLGLFSTTFLSMQEMTVFLVTIVYVFAFSLIATGASQLLMARYLSDLVFVGDVNLILPTMSGLLGATVLCQLVVGLPFLFFWDISFLFKISALMLFVAIGCIWQLMIFMSAVRNYKIVMVAFVGGVSLSFFLAIILGEKYGLAGFLHGYAIGQMMLLFLLLARVLVEFRSDHHPDFRFFHYFKSMPHLALIGLFYNLGIWLDKIVFWFSDEGQQINSFLYAYMDYDGATFFAFLSVIPSYTYFLVKVETDFYGYFRAFFQSVLNRQTYGQISDQKQKIARSLRESIWGLVKLQGAVTLICLLFAEELASLFRIPPLGSLILEKALIATFLQILLLTVMIFLMYFDIKKKVVFVAAVFVGANLIFTLLSLELGPMFYGYGYLMACLVALVLGYHFLNRHIRELEFRTFVEQPMHA